MKKTILLSATFLILAGSIAWADGDDPPSRAARLSYINGTVSFQPGSVDDWTPATLNRPMTTGDRLWTEPGARAEVNVGSAAVRLNGRTNLTVLNLDDRTVQLEVSIGTVSVRLRRLAEDETFEIDTPQMAMTLLRPGEYRVEVSEQGDATVAGVRGGEAEANAASQAFTIHPREQMRVMGVDQPVFDTRPLPTADAFDVFCEGRDRSEDMSVSAQHVSRDMPGYSDLDGAGGWRQDPQYGWVWAPRVDPGWAPYHYGHWAWIAPWGWTWVDDAPWGYAPFHYGRWVFAGGAWVWIPGPIAPRPVYAPAMVAWVGGAGFGVGIAVGGPAVGWFPLGPGEVFVPAYGYSRVYVERVNVTNTVIVNRAVFANVTVANVTYVNRGVVGAVTVVPVAAMTVGRPVAIAAVRVTPEVVARAQVSNVAVVAPERAAVLGARAQVGVAAPAPPAAVLARPAVARATPPPAPPSFAQQQQYLRQNPGQPVPRATVAQLQQSAPARTAVTPAIKQVNAPASPAARPTAPVPAERPAVNAPSQPASQQPELRRPAAPAASQQPSAPAKAQATPAQPATRTAPASQARPAAKQTDKQKSKSKQEKREEKER
jgi:hypothetical protein